MANYDWQTGNGDWITGADWGGTSPNSTAADATIAAAGSFEVSIAGGERFTVDSVTLANPAATLLIEGQLNLSGTRNLLQIDAGSVELGGVIQGGTIVQAGGSLVLDAGAQLVGVTVLGELTGPASGALSISGGINVETTAGSAPGTLALLNLGSQLNILDSETLNNLVIDLGSSAGGSGEILQANTGVTLGAQTTLVAAGGGGNLTALTGGTFLSEGAISIGGYGLGIVAAQFTNTGLINTAKGAEFITNGGFFSNQGTILADKGTGLYLDGATFENSGTVDVGAGAYIALGASIQNTGLIEIGGATDLALNLPNLGGLGRVDVAGGTVKVSGLVTNSLFGGFTFSDSGTYTTLFDVNTGGDLDLGGGLATITGVDRLEVDNGATIANGTIIAAKSPLLLTAGAKLDNITYIGDLTGPAGGVLFSEGSLVVENAAGNGPGTVSLVAYGNVFDLLGAETLDNMFIQLGTANGAADEYLNAAYSNAVDSLGSHLTIISDGDVGASVAGITGYTLVSAADMYIGGSGFDIDPLSFTNTGEIIVYPTASLSFEGTSFTNAGTVEITGNTVMDITATLNNTGVIGVSRGARFELESPYFGNLGDVAVAGGTIVLSVDAALPQFSQVTMSDSGGYTTLFDIVDGGSLALGGAVLNLGGADAVAVGAGGTLSGGTVVTALTPLELTAGASLSAITVIGRLDGPSSGAFYVSDGLSVYNADGTGPGTLNLDHFGGALDVMDSETLDNLLINLGVQGGTDNEFINAITADAPVTLGAHATVAAVGGNLGGAYPELSGFTMVNEGLIDIGATGFGIDLVEFVNDGLIEVSASSALLIQGQGFVNNGTIAGWAQGQVVVAEAVTGTGTFLIDPSSLVLEGAVSSGQSVSFSGAGGFLELGDLAGFNGTLTGLAPGDVIQADGQDITSETFVAGTGLVLNDGAFTLHATGTLATQNFTLSSNNGNTDLYVICYLEGTRISTPAGEVAIEDIRIGDPVVTRFNGVRHVRWIGRQRFNPAFARRNREVMPVRIAASALGEGVPARDLYVSGGHSMLVDGVLVLASALVNGVTVTWHKAAAELRYYQLEFETHDCVLAEGAWSESYADCEGLRHQFHNVAEYYALYREWEAPVAPRLCAERPESGAVLEAVLRGVTARAHRVRAMAG
jgi:hypothetical protein